MTEAEWNERQSPRKMLYFLEGIGVLTKRKNRLFEVAVCRRIWHLMSDPRSRAAVEIVERHTDGQAGDADLDVALRNAADALSSAETVMADARRDTSTSHARRLMTKALWQAASAAAMRIPYECAVSAVGHAAAASAITKLVEDYLVTWRVETAEQAAQAALLRDIVGTYPFRAIRIDRAWLDWNDCTVRRLAEAAYDDRTEPAGLLDVTRMAVLGDALEDAGCDDPVLPAHLRGPGPHVRGCFVLDFLLGKE
jgi:hypothetical protein